MFYMDKSRARLQYSYRHSKRLSSFLQVVHISSQIRNVDLDKFFQHEYQAYPPALSQMGGLRQSLIWSAAWKISLYKTIPPLLSYSTCLMGLQSTTCFDKVLQRQFLIMRPKCSCHTSHRSCNTSRLEVVWNDISQRA